MTNAKLKALIEKRNALKARLAAADAELSSALLEWSKERGYGVKLSAPQALRSPEMANG